MKSFDEEITMLRLLALMCNRLVILSVLALLAGTAAAVPPVGPAPAPRVAAPPAVVVPPMRADGSGVYRLNLNQALGAAPLTLVLEVAGGKITAAAGLANRHGVAWCPADASKLVYEAGSLRGEVTLECFNQFDEKQNRRFFEGKPNDKQAAYEFRKVTEASIALDVKCEGDRGAGTWSAKWGEANNVPYGPWTKRGEAGRVTLVREAPRLVPAVHQCDLFLYAALGDVLFGQTQPIKSAIWLRVGFDGDKQHSFAYAAVTGKLSESPATPLRFTESSLVIRNGKVTGRFAASVEGLDDSAFTLDITGHAIGRRLVGTVTMKHRDKEVTTQWIGLRHDVAAWPLPVPLSPAAWDWQHDQPADEALAARALAESQLPVMPGEPGKLGFWTWRKLTPHGPVSVIHPPCFDLKETDGAATYRFDITGPKENKVKRSFTADKPWRPLVPVWKELPVGDYTLVVAPLDAAGKEIAAPMRMGILDKATAKPVATEVKMLSFTKRPAFNGPYAKPHAQWLDTALAMGRWHRSHPGMYERVGIASSPSGNAFTTGGDHGYGVAVADRIWANLAVRALSKDPAERLLAEEMLHFNLEDLELHQRHNKPEGYIHDYQADTPLAYWIGTAIVEAYLATGDERWKDVAMKLGQALVREQKENGAFYSPKPDIRDPQTRRGPHGFFTWREGAIEFGAAELLYFFGRLRCDLKTDAFVEAEEKAYRWVMEHGVRERFWPINVSHSMSTGYPIWQHPVAALCFSRYLLECAPPQRRDVKLAEEVARWAEDVGVDWRRAAPGKQTGPITPRINAIDRYNNEPIAVNLLAAIVFEELAQATGDKLWSAKADALAVAVIQATQPGTGRPGSALIPNAENHCPILRGYVDPAHLRHWEFCNGWATQLLREYAAVRAAK